MEGNRIIMEVNGRYKCEGSEGEDREGEGG